MGHRQLRVASLPTAMRDVYAMAKQKKAARYRAAWVYN